MCVRLPANFLLLAQGHSCSPSAWLRQWFIQRLRKAPESAEIDHGLAELE